MAAILKRWCRNGIAAGVLVAGTALVTGHVTTSAQNEGGMAQGEQGMQEMMKLMERYGSPGEAHERMKEFVGTWNTKIEHWMDPNMPPSVSEGTAEYKMVLDGRYLLGHHTSEFMGREFVGFEMLGYDRYREQAFSMWFDNMSTASMVMRSAPGTTDLENMNMRGTIDDFMTGRRDGKVRAKTHTNDEGQAIYEMFMEMPGGEMVRVMRVTSTRAKKASGSTPGGG